MMNFKPCANDGDEACANCGKHGSDVVKLKGCTACRLVKYCGVNCQKADRKQHKKACKQRASELEDEQLYNQGHGRPEGDFCPICTLPIQLPMNEYSAFNICCMKRICYGCDLAYQKRGMHDCPFCRTPLKAQNLAMVPAANYFLGKKYYFGGLGLQKNMRMAIEMHTKAAELGSVEALYSLGRAYYYGEGVQHDKAKGTQFLSKAAMQGFFLARYALGAKNFEKGSYDGAVKHCLISAKMGHMASVEMVKKMFMSGLATKEQYAQALKGYQDAVEEMKSPVRDEAKRLGSRGA